jgi:LysM repeat protein
MTDTAAQRPAALPIAPDTAAVCPYLLAADGASRSSSPARDHRCHAVAPAAVLATEKQRRLCLVDEHLACSTYEAAIAGIGGPASRRVRHVRRPVTRTAPLILDAGRFAIALPPLVGRGVGQGGIVALMAVAFVALVVTRLGGGGPDLGPAAAGAAGSPGASLSASATAVAPTTVPSTPDAGPLRTLVPSDVEPTPDASPTSPPSSTPASPSRAPATHTVKSGDTLSGIAGKYGTTWQVLAELNKISDPSRLRVGQLIRLP